jgi:hypothetical protein
MWPYTLYFRKAVSGVFLLQVFLESDSPQALSVAVSSVYFLNLAAIRNFRSLACLLTRGASNCSPVSMIPLKNWSPVTLTPPKWVTAIDYQAFCSQ